MNIEELLNDLSQSKVTGELSVDLLNDCESLIRKEVASRVIIESNSLDGAIWNDCYCPNCNDTLDNYYSENEVNYCPNCGQRLLW